MEEYNERERGGGWRCRDEDADLEIVRGVNSEVGGTDAGGGEEGGGGARGDIIEEAALDGAIRAARDVSHDGGELENEAHVPWHGRWKECIGLRLRRRLYELHFC
jgi:hypothetical protein